MEGRIFVTSDTHFCHDKPFLYEPRGFSSIEEHDAAIVANWNSVVDEEDTVYMLGDAMLNDNVRGVELFKQLSGKIHYIIGNHDSDNRLYDMGIQCANIIDFSYAARVKRGKFHFYLTHYPTLTANADDGKYLAQHVINLCGHRHHKNRFCDMNKGFIYHCELDAHKNMPIEIDKIIDDLRFFSTLSMEDKNKIISMEEYD